jgi:hypothetical protein
MLALVHVPWVSSPARVSDTQGPPEAVILEQNIKEANRLLQQPQREAAPSQEKVKRRERLAQKFAILLVMAKVQHATIGQWHKAHSRGNLK